MAVNLNIHPQVYQRIKSGRFPVGLCYLCLAALEAADDMLLCKSCAADLPRNEHGCPVCAARTATGRMCATCLQARNIVVKNTVAIYQYVYPVNLLIQDMKFHSRLDIIAFFGQQISEQVLQHGAQLPQRLIPVPLHQSRLTERGYNQSLVLARRISTATGIPCDHNLCMRIRKTFAQADLPAGFRKQNVRGSFAVCGPLSGELAHVAIIDDVMTTGSTVYELASVLCAAGINRIDVWVCARA